MRSLAATLLLCAPVLAQSVPLPDGDVLQLYDVHDLIQATESETSDDGSTALTRAQWVGILLFVVAVYNLVVNR